MSTLSRAAGERWAWHNGDGQSQINLDERHERVLRRAVGIDIQPGNLSSRETPAMMMAERAVRQNEPQSEYIEFQKTQQELPVGSELLIAFTLGAAGWWLILILVRRLIG